MLVGRLVSLRPREEADVPVLHAELHSDVPTYSRAHGGPWSPVGAGPASPYAVSAPTDREAIFSVVETASDELAGVALMLSIDPHNRSAHVGVTLRPAFRGKGLAGDIVQVLNAYGFRTRGLHRLQLETLADNAAMIAAATRAGYRHEGTSREAAWVNGQFVDEVVFGLLAAEWSPHGL